MSLSKNNILLLSCLILITFLFCLYPYMMLAENTLSLNLEDKGLLFSLGRVLNNSLTKKALLNTAYVSILTSLSFGCYCNALGMDLKPNKNSLFKKVVNSVLYPLCHSTFCGAIAWISLASPSSGYLNVLFGKSVFDIYSLTGLVFVLSSFFYTYILLSLVGGMKNIDSSLEEAARLSGSKWI